MKIENTKAGDKVVLTVTKGDFKDSVITYTFVGTPTVINPTPTPEQTVTPETPKTIYRITAKSASNGEINPEGTTDVEEGDNQTYRIKANKGYEIEDVLVDGKSVGKVSTYKFKDIEENHTIEAKFVELEEEQENKFDDVTENDWFNESTMLMRFIEK